MNNKTVDVLIVGSGIMGATVARLVREQHPAATILMIDGAPELGETRGQHLHDSVETSVSEVYSSRVSSGVQGMYVGRTNASTFDGEAAQTTPGMYNASAFHMDARDMPAASLSWNVGGMGVHWTAACPTPWGTEIVPGIPAVQWEADVETARRVLAVDDGVFGTTPVGEAVLAALDEVFGPVSADMRHPRAMPMAMSPGEDGRLLRTSPNVIFPAIKTADDPFFELRPNTLCLRLEADAGRNVGAAVRDLVTGAEQTIRAVNTVVCADTFRTPQLLWASGIRPNALGRYLNEHAFLAGRVVVEPESLGIDSAALPVPRPGEWAVGSYWLPQSGEDQPFHGQIMDKVIRSDVEHPQYVVGLSWYVPTQIRADNRVTFSDDELDPMGLPAASIHFSYSEDDLALIDRARGSQAAAGRRLGDFDPATDSQLLDAGSSLHFTGTVRMGATDDGDSVCDLDGQVWGLSNLYLAGNGVVPTALACNSTLTGAITAVRAARSVCRSLASTMS